MMTKNLKHFQLRHTFLGVSIMVVVLFLLPPDSARAQCNTWSCTGNNLFYNLGSVGIGTSSPITSLQVVGEIYATGSQAALDFQDRTSGIAWAWYSTGNVARFWNNNVGDVLGITSTGNVGIGTQTPSTKLHVVGDVTVTGNIAAKYQDVAEWVPARRAIPAGAVVVLDPELTNHVLASFRAYDTRVAGVVSINPGVILGEGGENKVMVATTGRVRVRVDATRAAIGVGDLLVTSDKEGAAMKSEPLNVAGAAIHRPGTLIGKALEPLERGEGEILVLLSLQ